MTRTEETSTFLTVTISYLQVLLTVKTHSFVAFIAGACISSHLLALLARLLFDQTLLDSLYATKKRLSHLLLYFSESSNGGTNTFEFPQYHYEHIRGVHQRRHALLNVKEGLVCYLLLILSRYKIF